MPVAVVRRGLGRESHLRDDLAWSYVLIVALGATLVLITLLKGKIWTGLLGVFLPFVALVGAIRLARPHSPWARRRYRPGSAKAVKAEQQLARRWRIRALDHAENAIAGKPSLPPPR
ncbi:MAG: hypothetical protein L0Y54_04105 [Sporichthyaceae bacterium]|nr:hypothetical protein [Sporichthyaceae bacterium]